MTQLIPAWTDGRLQPVEKLQVHRLGLRHKAVSVFVMCGSRTLIQQRALGKYHTPGLWANSCCTHPQWAESSATCAQRRLAEELGITNLPLTYRGQVEYRADVGQGLIEHELVDIFVGETAQAFAPKPNPEEVAATEWIEIEALEKALVATPERFTPWLRTYLSDHKSQILSALV